MIPDTMLALVNDLNATFLSAVSFYLITLGVEGYCSMWSHTVTHSTLFATPLDEGSALHTCLYYQQYTAFTREKIHVTDEIRTCSPRKRSVFDPRLRQRSRWDWRKVLGLDWIFVCIPISCTFEVNRPTYQWNSTWGAHARTRIYIHTHDNITQSSH